jgi:hypothetical protein
MPLDQLVMPDMPELYNAAVQALNYCEGYAEACPDDFLNVHQRGLSQRKRLLAPRHFRLWLRSFLRCA